MLYGLSKSTGKKVEERGIEPRKVFSFHHTAFFNEGPAGNLALETLSDSWVLLKHNPNFLS